jgi:hypothetical protein
MRIITVPLLLALLTPGALSAQATGTLEPGSRLRLLLTPHDGAAPAVVTGTLGGSRADTLLIYEPGAAAPRLLPVSQVREASVLVGQRTQARTGAWAGAAVGALLLGTALYLDERSSDTCTRDCVYDNPSVVPMTILGLVAGGIAGRHVGRMVGARVLVDRWEPVPLDRLVIRPMRGGAAVGLSF